ESMLNVMRMHRDAADEIDNSCPGYLLSAAKESLDRMVALGESHGYRNSQVTVLAPTGTIAFMMDCDTTGIEPDIALVKYKLLAGEGDGTLKIINHTIPEALSHLGYDGEQIDEILAYINEHDMIEGAPRLKDADLPVFDCAFKPFKGTRSVSPMGHIRMMAACQPFVSGAISKTVNMPEEVTSKEIANAYMEGWRLGLKALAIYRENSKRSQPLSTSNGGNTIGNEAAHYLSTNGVVPEPVRRRLPDSRMAFTHKFSVGGHEGYLHVGLYPESGQPGEIFIRMAKEGSTLSGLMEAFAICVSVSLQYGVPLEDLCAKFSFMRFEPSGYTNNRDLPQVQSIIDYLFRWMSKTFLDKEGDGGDFWQELRKTWQAAHLRMGDDELFDELYVQDAMMSTAGVSPAPTQQTPLVSVAHHVQGDAPICTLCGSIMMRNGACYVCTQCGTSSGCG
ncbi:MAG: intein-containing adenosylcobalamin-dependent ribonucleoside-diphosphate reductase, partial [Rhodothermaceae bacterium]|nr:intein-containing adenosylcobalamin-dependent ribonucleoside-diphosphate reductase [Rhodothermaceae bacterium]MYD19864.1 intein-containing adenosylcobalamin-dependent ribonucleoside-diphosphate reductase [Rhodothermaceae bacterium]